MLKTRTTRVLVILSLLVASIGITAVPVGATEEWEGCTPGYWKNHPDAWVGYSPYDLVGDVFPSAPAELAGDTLMDALNYMGGTGFVGAAKILLRAAVASLLNGAHPDVYFKWSDAEIVMWTEGPLKSGDRYKVLKKAEKFDYFNNSGCPL